MSFIVQASPGIKVREIDLTTVVTPSPATDGAFAGRFKWGPLYEAILCSNTKDMERLLGKPATTAESVDFLTASSFLAYTDSLRAVRVGDLAVMKNASTNGAIDAIANDAAYDDAFEGNTLDAGFFVARYPGQIADGVEIHVADGASFVRTETATVAFTKGSKTVTLTYGAAVVGFDAAEWTGEYIALSGVKYSIVAASINSPTNTIITLTLSKSFSGTTGTAVSAQVFWQFHQIFGVAPEATNFHVVTIDVTGNFLEVPNTLMDKLANVSATDTAATYEDGTSRYLPTALKKSGVVRVLADFATLAAGTYVFAGGKDSNSTVGNDELIDGYQLFVNAEEIDTSLVITPAVTDSTLPNFIIDNVLEVRKDCVGYFGPKMADVVNNKDGEVVDVKATRKGLSSTTYGVFCDNWKYMYDKYNDRYVWVPTTGDIAGLTARTDETRAAWFSPAGFSRGVLKNVIKLAWSANESQRDELYQSGINSVVNFNGVGKVLYGDKTMAADQSSAFSRINVRRLFLVLEKAIANAAKTTLFEFNDEFTRGRFVSIVEPFLREVQAGRGVTDFLVVCDETNNTPQVIDTNNFVGDIYIKP